MSLHTCHNDLVRATLPGTQHVVEGRVVGGDTERVEIAWKPEGDDRRTVLYLPRTYLMEVVEYGHHHSSPGDH